MSQWREKTSETGVYSNFGALWVALQAKLTAMTGRYAIPCSSGTEAVALGIAAAHNQEMAPLGVAFEAFTFQATAVAARRVDPNAMAQRTNFDARRAAASVVVRTVPFGMHRRIFAEPGDEQLVIDAAGAFGPGALDVYPEDAFVAVSFHATKNYPIGEGGCLFLPRAARWAHRSALAAMNFGMDSKRELVPGYQTNAKLDELRCALLLHQLERAKFFQDRSARIGQHSRRVADSDAGAWLPYMPGVAQSLVVVAHARPVELVAELAKHGFVARRVYHPYLDEALLTYDESHMVALPSDMTEDELLDLISIMRRIR